MTIDFNALSDADRQTLNLEYLPRLTLPDVDGHLEKAAARSAQVRARLACQSDIAYGDSPGQTIDVFPGARPDAPVFFFIHGGYWRALDKHFYSECAGPMVEAGAAAMLVNYDLCPTVRITDIVDQVRRALTWVHENGRAYNADPDRIYVSGHSAGGHLTGMMMTTDWKNDHGMPADLIKGAFPLSGLFDIEPHRHTELQEDIRLTPEEVHDNSPQHLDIHFNGPVLVAVGGDESDSFKKQSRSFARKCEALGLASEYLETGSDNHFDITDRLGDANDELTTAIIGHMGLG